MYKWLESVTNDTVVSHSSLKGGISSKISVVYFQKSEPLVVREITDTKWLEQEPDLIQHERASLDVMVSSTVPTPTFIAMNKDTHMLSMTHLPGRVRLDLDLHASLLRELSETLLTIHATEIPPHFLWEYEAYTSISSITIPSWVQNRTLWEDAIHLLKTSTPTYIPTFIHRDYHPTNILWEGDSISGVVDWVNACIGPAYADVGHCRMNLAVLYGVETANDFLAYYMKTSTQAYDVYFDLRAFFDFVDEEFDVYQGWIDLGKLDLTVEVLRQRAENYLSDLIPVLY
ncbi:phosphotransferase family protein [Paenisporosarcina cavernae]|uniref:Aminoglycoside phosphotransferase family protein n=1 Tax=Paenisporosarcina cavernae TaxID=2320858 RepID=A0A385YUX2_9BACL|nr:aminoglycoside phosphotransferase family protein [Paenisporosarcina cavernae]AYC30486.1 aminoglycoside phosphotransferase family protein [Paenisporosarcina cavernae]